jgi:hypothetical protein
MKRGCTTRAKETRERYERPRRQVDGNSNPHCRLLWFWIKSNWSLKVSQAGSAKETKLIRFLGNSPAKVLASRWACNKSKHRKSSYKWLEVFTATDINDFFNYVVYYKRPLPSKGKQTLTISSIMLFTIRGKARDKENTYGWVSV